MDLVLTNPPIRAGLPVVRRLLADAARVLVPGGRLLFVGRPKQGGRRLAEIAAASMGSPAEKLLRHKGYEVFELVRSEAPVG